MRKRNGRHPRFAAVPNETIDDAVHLDLTALGLLTVLLRHQDGWEITLADIGKRYGYGEDAMAAAMGLLQVARYVLKVRIMTTDGLWSTEVVVYDTPASDQEITGLLAAIGREPDVRRAQLIHPTQTAMARAAKRQAKLGRRSHRLREFPESVTTCGNVEKSQVVTDSGVVRDSVNPRVSKKTVSKKTKNSSPSSPMASSEPPSSHAPRAEEGEEAKSGDSPLPARTAEVVAWVEALPWRRQPGRRQREHLARLVEGAQAAGWSPDALRRELTVELEGVRSLYAVWAARLEQLPAPALAPVIPLARSVESTGPSCAQHPGAGRRGAECAGCWSERYG